MSLAAQVKIDSPNGYWPLTETAGSTTALDGSGNARNLTIESGVTPGAAAVVPGLGPSMDFLGSGTANGLTIADAAWQSSHAGPNGLLSLECWFIPDTVNTIMALNRKGTTSNWEYAFVTSATGQLNFLTFNLAGTTLTNVISAAGVLVAGRLYHAVAVYDKAANFAKIYLNGVEIATGTTGTDSADGTAPVFIGVRQDDTQHFNGRMGHVAMYPTALSAARVKAHYDAGIRSGIVLGPGAYGTNEYGTTSYAGGSGNQTPAITAFRGVANDSFSLTSAATGRVVFKGVANDTITFTSVASGSFKLFAETWTVDESQDGRVTITSFASGRIIVPADIPAEYGSQVISIDATGGTFTITINGETTDPIAWNASASDVQAALVGLPGVDPGDITATGGDGGPWTLNYAGQFSGESIPTATVNTAGLTGGTSTAVVLVRPKLFVKRVSLTMPTPVLNSRGQPI